MPIAIDFGIYSNHLNRLLELTCMYDSINSIGRVVTNWRTPSGPNRAALIATTKKDLEETRGAYRRLRRE